MEGRVEVKDKLRGRLFLWLEALEDAERALFWAMYADARTGRKFQAPYMMSEQTLPVFKNRDDAGRYKKDMLGTGYPDTFASMFPYEVREMLYLYSVVRFCALFNRGDKSENDAHENDHPEVEGFRNEILGALLVCGIDSNVLKKVQKLRNKMVAHQDAEAIGLNVSFHTAGHTALLAKPSVTDDIIVTLLASVPYMKALIEQKLLAVEINNEQSA